jgi:thymidylate synthase (FAD)
MHIDELLTKESAMLKQEKLLDPLKDGISSLELVRISGSDLDVVNAARVSYGKTSTEVSERDKKLITFLMEYQHTSPFEHNQMSFRVKAPLFVARQWMRHRMNSYNELSYRYSEAKFEYYIPQEWRTQDKINKQASGGGFKDDALVEEYKKSITQAMESYHTLLQGGVCRELARAVLPVCLYTEFIFTCNLHSLMHFLRLRLDPGAQHEIRAYAQGMLELVEPFFPVSLEAWKKFNGADKKEL